MTASRGRSFHSNGNNLSLERQADYGSVASHARPREKVKAQTLVHAEAGNFRIPIHILGRPESNKPQVIAGQRVTHKASHLGQIALKG